LFKKADQLSGEKKKSLFSTMVVGGQNEEQNGKVREFCGRKWWLVKKRRWRGDTTSGG
jgi:hypothetical protein